MVLFNAEEFYDKILDGWMKCYNANGVPYYQNHKYERTQWDHPIYEKTLEEMGEFNQVKYAAYRTAMKLIFLRKQFYLNYIDIHAITVVFEKHGFVKNDGILNCAELEFLLTELCLKMKKDRSIHIDVKLNSELLMNWILNLYDVNRTGSIRLLSVKIALAALSTSSLIEKYKYFFYQASCSGNVLERQKFAVFLRDLMQLVDVLNESSPFGGMSICAALDNCFQRVANGIAIYEEAFLDWMFDEPQTLVWLPTFHRIVAGESVTHDKKCKLCKAYPITGLRYRCLKCFNFDLCQMCFYTGKVNSKHKINHPTQEYCVSTSSKENTKAVFKTIRNNISKKYKTKINKPSYLPISQNNEPILASADNSYHWDGFAPDALNSRRCSSPAYGLSFDDYLDNVDKENIPDTKKSQQTSFFVKESADSGLHLNQTEQKELESIIIHLEDENRVLLDEIERLHEFSFNGETDNDIGEFNTLKMQKEHLEAKQKILESHNKHLEDQLRRLKKVVLQKGNFEGNQTQIPVGFATVNVAPESNFHCISSRQDLGSPQRVLIEPPPYTDSDDDLQPFFSQNLQDPKLTTDEYFIPKHDVAFDSVYLDNVNDTDISVANTTRFDIPPLFESITYPDEEAELHYLVQQLKVDLPVHTVDNFRNLDNPSSLEKMYEATNNLGDAMSEFVDAIKR